MAAARRPARRLAAGLAAVVLAGMWSAAAGAGAPDPMARDTGPRVRVNQVAYLPQGPKNATLVTEAADALPWQLRNETGRVVAEGETRPAGFDRTSGLNVHEIDFSRFQVRGTDYALVADGQVSEPFDLSAVAFERLVVDALAFFYPQRSGTAIDDDIAGEGYGRAAGHVGEAPNRGDYDVPCQRAAASRPIYREPWTCDYTLDVVGGWYDAGDYGKYVVNGGIAVHQLLGLWERAANSPSGEDRRLGDATLRIPERGNGVPDVLDEARWELEWMLSMQVPAGEPLAGMVHHKVHGSEWTDGPLPPSDDRLARQLHRPSTAATLNLAAVAAHGARLFDDYDPGFAARLLAAARVAWHAAQANPPLLAPAISGRAGGGPYADDEVGDEFYWAAAELYLTTGEAGFADAVVTHPFHHEDAFTVTGFYWGSVAALGRLDLATVANQIPGLEDVRRSVVDAADAIVEVQRRQPWGQAYAPADNHWEWGSNSQILNNLVVVGTAYDLTRHATYRNAVLESLDYLLGRNAVNLSFVTGYGDRYAENQLSLWYANQLDPTLPHPPRGALAGGPNSGLQDPFARYLLEGCAPQFCYVDDIASYSTNEIAINWNSALSWVAAFVADLADGAGRRTIGGRTHIA